MCLPTNQIGQYQILNAAAQIFTTETEPNQLNKYGTYSYS